MARPGWSRAEDERLCRMARDGLRGRIMAAELRRPYGNVHWRLSYLRRNFLDPYGPAFPADHDATIQTMARAGQSDHEIAAALSVRVDVVAIRRRYYGWCKRVPVAYGSTEPKAAVVDVTEILGPVEATLDVVRDWQRRNAPDARTLGEVNAVRLAKGVPGFVVRRV